MMGFDEGDGPVVHDVGKPEFVETMRRVTGKTLEVPTLAERLKDHGGAVILSNVYLPVRPISKIPTVLQMQIDGKRVVPPARFRARQATIADRDATARQVSENFHAKCGTL